MARERPLLPGFVRVVHVHAEVGRVLEAFAALGADVVRVGRVIISVMGAHLIFTVQHFTALFALKLFMVTHPVRVQELFVAIRIAAGVAHNANAVFQHFFVKKSVMTFVRILRGEMLIAIAKITSEMKGTMSKKELKMT